MTTVESALSTKVAYSGGVSSAVRLTTPADSSPPSRKLNASPSTVEDKEMLKKMLTTPPLYKQFKKRVSRISLPRHLPACLFISRSLKEPG
jgi:hypothetical protein